MTIHRSQKHFDPPNFFTDPSHTSSTDSSHTAQDLCRVVALGASAGGLQAISVILTALPANFPAPIVIVQHLSPHTTSQMARILNRRTALHVKEAEDADRLQVGTVYIAPPARHLIVHPDETLALSNSEKVHHSRPSADVLFVSLARSLGPRAIGVVLTGGDGDGAEGIRAIKAAGGITLAQDEQSSEQPSMPRRAAETGAVDYVLPLSDISATLMALVATSLSPATPLSRVQDASTQVGRLLGSMAQPRDDGRQVTKTLAELDGCLDVLNLAEKALRDQNHALEHYQRTLRDEHARYSALIQVISDTIIATDIDGVIRAVNPTAAGLLGKNPKYMVGKHFAHYAQEEQHLAFDSVMTKVLAAREWQQAGDWQQSLRLQTRRGLAPVRATASAIKNERGVVIGLHWLVRCENSA